MKLDIANYLAIELLEKCGRKNPTQKQIDLMSAVLSRITFIHKLNFNPKLTEREISCLFWAALGKTSKETAKLLALQPYTIEEYRKEIKQKLECKSMAEAVFKGMRFGYLQTFDIKESQSKQ
ncbi:MAG TPA: helix-turn-helix transcriptional regulator [Gammaproteobacteria bacterium]|jgi:DNA-binding CsgD family transcriptional regulator|nr:helix-turn-helix transcriptional regulator [Gammaproteobacteria bacterium]